MSVMPILYMRLAYEGGGTRVGAAWGSSARARRARGGEERASESPACHRGDERTGSDEMRAARGDARGFAPGTPA